MTMLILADNVADSMRRLCRLLWLFITDEDDASMWWRSRKLPYINAAFISCLAAGLPRLKPMICHAWVYSGYRSSLSLPPATSKCIPEPQFKLILDISRCIPIQYIRAVPHKNVMNSLEPAPVLYYGAPENIHRTLTLHATEQLQ